MIYVKSILAGVAAVAVAAILALAFIALWWLPNTAFLAVTTRQIMGVVAVCSLCALAIFAAGFNWELRRLSHSK